VNRRDRFLNPPRMSVSRAWIGTRPSSRTTEMSSPQACSLPSAVTVDHDLDGVILCRRSHPCGFETWAQSWRFPSVKLRHRFGRLIIPTLDEMLIRQDAIGESRLITTKLDSTNELSMDHADLPGETIYKATVEGTGHQTPAVRCTLSHAREVRGRVKLPAMRSRFTLLFEVLVAMVSGIPVKTVARIVGEHDTRAVADRKALRRRREGVAAELSMSGLAARLAQSSNRMQPYVLPR